MVAVVVVMVVVVVKVVLMHSSGAVMKGVLYRSPFRCVVSVVKGDAKCCSFGCIALSNLEVRCGQF